MSDRRGRQPDPMQGASSMPPAASRRSGASASHNYRQQSARASRSASSRAAVSRSSSVQRDASSARAPRNDPTAGSPYRPNAQQPARSATRSSSQAVGAGRKAGSYKPASERSGLKIGIIIGVVVALVAVFVIGYIALAHSSVLRIERIEATGVEHLTADEIEQLAAIPDDASLLTVDEAQIRDNLMQDAWIQDVKVKRVLPNTLKLEVTERQIAAVVSIPSSSAKITRRWAISSDGIWLMPIPDQTSEAGKTTSSKVYEDAANALQITDVPYGEQPEIGTKCTNEYVNCALDVVTGLTTSLKDQVVSVKANDTQSVTLVLDSNIEVVFGDAEDIREKERICLELLERYPNQISYINVRSIENPTWRNI